MKRNTHAPKTYLKLDITVAPRRWRTIESLGKPRLTTGGLSLPGTRGLHRDRHSGDGAIINRELSTVEMHQ